MVPRPVKPGLLSYARLVLWLKYSRLRGMTSSSPLTSLMSKNTRRGYKPRPAYDSPRGACGE